MVKKNKGLILLAVMVPVLLLSVVGGILLGSTVISPYEFFRVLLCRDTQSTFYRILMFVRIPRVCAGLLCGSALSVAGVLLQAILHNPLASPNIIGVNNGAGLMVLICAAIFPTTYAFLPIAAFFGALTTAMLMFALAMGNRASKVTLVLTGIAVSSVFGAGMNSILIIAPEVYTGAAVFLVGGLSGVTFQKLLFPAIYIFIGLILSMFLSRHLNVLSLGDSTAHTLGMPVAFIRFLAIFATAILTGAAISFAGLIGFVGLIIPHAIRFVIGADHRYLIPVSALAGGSFVTLCDVAARTLFAPYELPVGILMSFIGGPFFIFLILRSRRKIND